MMDIPRLPDFAMPFPEYGVNPALQRATSGMWRWLDDFGLCPTPRSRRHIEKSQPDLCMAYYYPALDAEALVDFSRFCAWAFIVDDQFDDGPVGRSGPRCRAAIEELLPAIGGGTAGSTPLTRAISDVWPRLTAGRSPLWCQSFRDDVIAWLWTYYSETVDRASGRLPLLAAFRQHRRDAVGEPMFFDMCEIAAGADLPAGVRRLGSLIDLRDAGTEQIGLYNDLHSFAKETAAGYAHNAVAIVLAGGDASAAQAHHAVNAMVTDCVERMVLARRQLPAQLEATGLDEPTRRQALDTAAAYTTLVRGNYDYHFAVRRYTDPHIIPAGGTAHVPDLFTPC